MPYRFESATILRVTTALAALGLLCIVSIAGLAWARRPIPDALASIGGGAVAALATLLTTFTPSPVPGGRRSSDATGPSDLGGPGSSTTPPSPSTVSVGPAGVVGEGSNAAGR